MTLSKDNFLKRNSMIFSLRSKIKKIKIKGESAKHVFSKSIFFGNYQTPLKKLLGEICMFFILLVRSIWNCAIVHILEIVFFSSIVKVTQLYACRNSRKRQFAKHHPAGSRGSRISQIKNRNIAAVAFSISKPLSSEFQFLGAIM